MRNWYFVEAAGHVMCRDKSVQLTPKAASVLACLIRNRGEVVSVETFLDEVWQGINVTPDLVREYVSDLRAALGDDARQPKYIETVRGRGFRLVGGVESVASEGLADSVRAGPEIRPTVAVLRPLALGDEELGQVAEAVAVEIINQLAGAHYIGVLARQISFRATGVDDLLGFARDAHAEFLLESSFARLAGTLRARVQLVDVATGRNLWAERYDYPADDLRTIIDEMPGSVVSALVGWHGELHRAQFKSVIRKHAEDLNSYEHFILGCDLELSFSAESVRKCLYHLQKSTEMDPNFARAWVVYALMSQWAYDVLPERDRALLAQSAQAFEKAFMLDPGDPLTMALIALKLTREGRMEDGLALLRRAEAGSDGDADAKVCAASSAAVLLEDPAVARRLFDAAVALNPTPPSFYAFVEVRVAFFEGDYERCIACAQAARRQPSALIFKCLSLAMLDRAEPARLAHDDLFTTFPDVDLHQFADYFPIAHPAARRRYDAAVAQLERILDATARAWPRLATERGRTPGRS